MTHTEEIMFLQKQINTANFDQIERLEEELEELKQLIANDADGRRYKSAIALLGRKLADLKREKTEREEISELEKDIKRFELEVLNIKIPVFKNPVSLFEELRQRVVKFEGRLDSHKDNCSSSNSLRQDLKDVKIKIDSLDKDNKIALGWLGTSTTLTAASIGVAFVPVVGLPIAAGMNVVPYIGKLAHRLSESSSRKEMFTQKDG